jgi:hypothetical protein
VTSEGYTECGIQTQSYNKPDSGISKMMSDSVQKTLELLFKQEQEFEKMPYELSLAAERKKRLRQRQRHL